MTKPYNKSICRMTNMCSCKTFPISTPNFIRSHLHLLFSSIPLKKMSSYHTNSNLSYIKVRDALVSFEKGLNFGIFSPLVVLSVRLVDFSFLKSASIFWSPGDHFFSFGVDELCLTYEEFSWLFRMGT